jgi:hypothetical protein
MEVEFLQTGEIDKALSKLIDEYDECHWASAWASLTATARKLLRSPAKLKNVIFGVAFGQTDPALIDSLVGVRGTAVVTRFAGGTFHPKVYCFRKGNKATAVIGSANFTFGGLGTNLEAAVLVEGNANDPLFKDLFAFIKRCGELGEPVTQEFASAYRASCRRMARFGKPPLNPLDSLPKVRPEALSSPLVTMSWAEYVREIQASGHHDLDESLKLLQVAQGWFASVGSFSNLSLGQRQAIAGLVVDKAERGDPDLGRDWGWFGSMRGMGDFAKLIIASDRHLTRAIDSVPQKGEVTKRHFENFVRHFERAFENSDRTGGYATASRLLAMKRPDTFICICKPNITEAASRMGFSRWTLTLSHYWEKVVEVVRFADWYNVDKPENADGELWEARVAMLDAIFYQPD